MPGNGFITVHVLVTVGWTASASSTVTVSYIGIKLNFKLLLA